jgi:hypothetical protein
VPVADPVFESIGKWQATLCRLASSRNSGTSVSQRDCALKHRVRNTQPLGGLLGLGKSPVRIILSRERSKSGSAIGTADSKAWV